MALAYSGIKLELREILLKDRPDELYHASAKGTVPVVITHSRRVIDESLEIMLWALENFPEQTWLSEDSTKEMDMINLNDTEFKKWLDKYKYHSRNPEQSKEHYREKCREILDHYEQQLTQTDYLVSQRINVTDVAIFPFIRQFANVDIQWFQDQYKYLFHWLDRFCNSSLFTSVMKKYVPWSAGDEPLILKFQD